MTGGNFWPRLIAEGAFTGHHTRRAPGPRRAVEGARSAPGIGKVHAGPDRGGLLVVFLTFGGVALPEGTRFIEILAALTGVAGSIVGFYFGSGGSSNLSARGGSQAPPPNAGSSSGSSGSTLPARVED